MVVDPTIPAPLVLSRPCPFHPPAQSLSLRVIQQGRKVETQAVFIRWLTCVSSPSHVVTQDNERLW